MTDACALYRMFIPHLHMPSSRFIFKWGPVQIDEFAEAQVVVVQRQVSPGNLQAIRNMKAHGLKIIYDTDDNLWALPAANPGKRFVDAQQEGFGICAAECDLITVSTRGLQSAVKSALRHLNKDVIVCPNAIDLDLFQPPSVDRDPDRVVIGWAGSNTHGEDIQEAWGILPDIIEKYPQVHMEFVGMDPPRRILNHPRVKIRRWIPVGEFMSRFASWAWDITIAPLADNRFNRSKCLSTETSVYGLVNWCPVRKKLLSFLSAPGMKHLPGPDGKWRRVVASEKMPEELGYSVKIRGGDCYHVTRYHKFRLNDFRIVEARNLKVGDCIDEVTYKDLPRRRHVLSESCKRIDYRPIADYDMGWFIGQYIGDGVISRHADGPRGGTAQIGICLDDRRTDLATRLVRIAERWGGTWTVRHGKAGSHAGGVRISSLALKGFVQQYVAGKDCYTKHLRKAVWSQDIEFMRGIVDGWLDADGRRPVSRKRYLGRSHVWSFGITRNWNLIRDMQLLCLLVGYRFKFKRAMTREPNTGKYFKCVVGSVRKVLKNYNSSKRNGEIIAIRKIKVSTCAVEVDGDHLFVLPSGVVTHNSNIKMLEAASLGIPCLVSMVAPYEEFCALADTKWLLCLTQQQWREKLTTLIHEPATRLAFVQKMRACADNWYNITRLKDNWIHAYNMVLS